MQLVDRKAEQDLFDSLLGLGDTSRLLTIWDEGGNGKSKLLSKFKDKCKWHEPAIPVSLTVFGELADQTKWALVDAIRANLAELEFRRYAQIENSRIAKDFSLFSESAASAGGSFSAPGGTFGGGIQAGNIGVALQLQAENASIDLSSFWTKEVERKARGLAVTAFLEDLARIAREQAVVILLDAFEHCDADLAEWIEVALLRDSVFVQSDSRQVLVVVAGRTVPDLRPPRLTEERYGQFVRPIGPLSLWDETHVKTYLERRGIDDPASRDITYLCEKLQIGWTIDMVARHVDLLLLER